MQLVELSQAQDIEAGDGTTSVVVLAGSLLGAAEKLLAQGKSIQIEFSNRLANAWRRWNESRRMAKEGTRNKEKENGGLTSGIHPTTIAHAFQNAATKSVEFLEGMSTPVDLNDRESLLKAASTSLNSKVSYLLRLDPQYSSP
jgi:T-complex protein 1 subunit delta